jgi:PBP1b-binding outer membrane lipoprotein LpoB
MSKRIILGLLLLVVLASGCSSTGTLGIVTKSSANPAALLQSAQGFEVLTNPLKTKND